MREIIFDTETTGFDPLQGHRLIEIGCVEMIDGVITGNHYHVYLNPERDVPLDAVAVHGITTAFLRDKPVFASEVGGFLDFIGENDRLVAHNAKFDMTFINFELGRLGFPAIAPDRVVDTLQMAREKFPGAQASLDALCRRFEVDLTNRDLHGALIDAHLLAQCYIELTGGRQRALELLADTSVEEVALAEGVVPVNRTAHLIAIPAEVEASHEALLDKIKDPLWRSA